MDYKVDNKTHQELFSSLARMQEERRKQLEKRQQKIWIKINMPANLADTLNMLTKNDLDTIRKNLNLKNMSALRKEDLIKQLVKFLPTKFVEVLNLLDRERYELIVKMVKKGGLLSATHLSLSKIEFFMGYGLAFPGVCGGRKLLFMPKELIEAFNKIDSMKLKPIVQLNTEWIKLTYGLLYYYGVMSTWAAKNKINKFTNKEIDFLEYINVLSLANDYYKQVKLSYGGFYDGRVIDPQAVIEEQKSRPDIDYYPFTKSQLLKAGEPGYIDKTPSMNNLMVFLASYYDIETREIEEIMSFYHHLINLDAPPSEILNNLEQRFEFPSFEFVQKITTLVIDLCNNTRRWILKGYTPNEILLQEKLKSKPVSSPDNAPQHKKADVINFKTGKRVGRNDPCPCGSGKKFKKCCGINQ
ncbi:MAG: zinc chelation protein SecC [Peptococcaceae bacterium]|nr:zinc chelation protein SecC [Peptococcaceae bacterium]